MSYVLLVYYLLTTLFISDTMMKTKWKCNHCQKTLASKQTALKHVKVLHKDLDPTNGISKVKVQVNDEELIETSNSKQVPKVKNKAYGFFSQLSSMFSDDSLVERFDWGKSSKPKDKSKSDQSESTSGAFVTPTRDIPGTVPVSRSSSLDPINRKEPTSIPVAPDITVSNEGTCSSTVSAGTDVVSTNHSSHPLGPHSTSMADLAVNSTNNLTSGEQMIENDELMDLDLNQSGSSLDISDIVTECEDTTFDFIFRGTEPEGKTKNVLVGRRFMTPTRQVPDMNHNSRESSLSRSKLDQTIHDGNFPNITNMNLAAPIGNQTNGQFPSSLSNQSVGQSPFSLSNQSVGKSPSSISNQSVGQAPSSLSNQSVGQSPSSISNQSDGQSPSYINRQCDGHTSSSISNQGVGQSPYSISHHSVWQSSSSISHQSVGQSLSSISSNLTVQQPLSSPGRSEQSVQPLNDKSSAPFKTRGHCGSTDCPGCNREPCESCYNCLHKRETRYFFFLICSVKSSRISHESPQTHHYYCCKVVV